MLFLNDPGFEIIGSESYMEDELYDAFIKKYLKKRARRRAKKPRVIRRRKRRDKRRIAKGKSPRFPELVKKKPTPPAIPAPMLEKLRKEGVKMGLITPEGKVKRKKVRELLRKQSQKVEKISRSTSEPVEEGSEAENSPENRTGKVLIAVVLIMGAGWLVKQFIPKRDIVINQGQ